MSLNGYRAEIDGLRAIAVLPVILFHMNRELLPGGYIGVDIFFVISGFLITSIILKEYDRGTFSFANFWLRRVRRILPALTTMVLVTLAVGSYILYGPDVNNLGRHGIASLLSFANFSHLKIAGNYWGDSAESSPLLHTWSLSVEEQYYLLFPLLLVLTLKYFHKRLALVFTVLGLLSLVLFFVGTQTNPSKTFYLIQTRAWELGVGALLSILFFKKHLKFNDNPLLSALGFFAVLLSFFIISGTDQVSSLLVIPVFGTAFIIAFAKDSNNITNRLLSAPPVVYVGKLSYSLYLWHWPVLVFSRQLGLKNNLEFNPLALLLVIFLLSILSYHFIEVPTRQNKKIVPYVISILVVGVAISFFLKYADITEDTSVYDVTRWNGDLYNVNPQREWPESIKKRFTGITVARNDNFDSAVYSEGGIKKLYGSQTPEIVVFGDSHALMWGSVLDEAAKGLDTSISFFSADGTPTFFDIPPVKGRGGTIFFSAEQKYLFDLARLNSLVQWKPKVVVISSLWSSIDDVQITEDLIQYIGKLGSKVLLIEQPPELYFGDKNAPQYLSYLGLTPANNSKQYIPQISGTNYNNGRKLVAQLAEKYGFCHMVKTSDLFLTNENVFVVDSREVLYVDDDHLSYAGSLKAKDRIVGALKEYLGDTPKQAHEIQ